HAPLTIHRLNPVTVWRAEKGAVSSPLRRARSSILMTDAKPGRSVLVTINCSIRTRSGSVSLSHPLPSQDVAPRSVSSDPDSSRNPVLSFSDAVLSHWPLLFASHSTIAHRPCLPMIIPCPWQCPAQYPAL